MSGSWRANPARGEARHRSSWFAGEGLPQCGQPVERSLRQRAFLDRGQRVLELLRRRHPESFAEFAGWAKARLRRAHPCLNKMVGTLPPSLCELWRTLSLSELRQKLCSPYAVVPRCDDVLGRQPSIESCMPVRPETRICIGVAPTDGVDTPSDRRTGAEPRYPSSRRCATAGSQKI